MPVPAAPRLLALLAGLLLLPPLPVRSQRGTPSRTPPPALSPWSRLPELPQARGGSAVAWLGDRLVVAGGSYWKDETKRYSERVDAFNPAAGVWREVAPIPEPVASPGTAVDQEALYLVGGTTTGGAATRACWKLTPQPNWDWTRLPDLPEPRAYGAAAVLGNRLYFTASCRNPSDLNSVVPDAWVLNLARLEQGWRQVAPPPGPARCLSAAAVVRDRLYLFGGCHGNAGSQAVNVADVVRYDPDRDRWEQRRALPRPLRTATAAVLPDGGIALAGGYSGGPTDGEQYGPAYGFERRVLIYNPGRDRFTEAAPLPIANATVGLGVGPERLHAVGGEDRARSRTDAHFAVTLAELRVTRNRRPVLVCLGDSVTDGVGRSGVTAEQTYPRVLERTLSGRDPAPWVVGAGRGGENSRQALQRISSVFRPLPRVDYVVVMYGLNDAALIDPGPADRVEARIPLDEYGSNLRALLAECRRQGAVPLLCTPNPMTRRYPYANRGAYARNSDINFMVRRYAEEVRRVAGEERVPLVDVDRVFRDRSGWEELFPDGIHPNAEGLTRIAGAIQKVLQPPAPE
ncbi:MAG: hypothetical protein FJX77_09080 [Armatimonadetes bacterium]|nr:hypothetical protein [Armatimonadota bacterium]